VTYPPEKQDLMLELLRRGDADYRQRLIQLAPQLTDVVTMPHVWGNDTFPTFDAMSLWANLKEFKPPRIIEIGSGRSTMIMLEARKRGLIQSHITCIDPGDGGLNNATLNKGFFQEVDRFIGEPVQNVDPALFVELNAGDLLFIDGSHICSYGSDVAYTFLEIYPRLKPGVIVHHHDILWPFDYPIVWHQQRRGYNEHYLMAAMLLADQGRRYKIWLPARYLLSHGFETSLRDWTAAAASVGMEFSGNAERSRAFMGYQGTGFWMEVI
jgi:predicted O-methyltransferase YrrM